MNKGQHNYDIKTQNRNIKRNLQKFFEEQNQIQNTCSDKMNDNMHGASSTIKGIKQKKMHVF